MNTYWIEQTEADVPAADDWLCANEAAHLATLRFPKRRADWRLGRWTAKQAVAAYFEIENRSVGAAEVEIRAADSGAPEVFICSKPAAVAISLSHCNGVAICAVAPAGTALGCDLEKVEPRSDAFLADYFTEEEHALAANAPVQDRDGLVALLWSAKESALKALQEGLRLDTRSVVVAPECASTRAANRWEPLSVRCGDGRMFSGWWQRAGDLVRTVVTAAPSSPPIQLSRPRLRTWTTS